MGARWKMDPKETGLARVGAGPRGARLYEKGEEVAIASVAPMGGDWRGDLRGWYWIGFGRPPSPLVPTCEEAKAQAMAFYKAQSKTKGV